MVEDSRRARIDSILEDLAHHFAKPDSDANVSEWEAWMALDEIDSGLAGALTELRSSGRANPALTATFLKWRAELEDTPRWTDGLATRVQRLIQACDLLVEASSNWTR